MNAKALLFPKLLHFVSACAAIVLYLSVPQLAAFPTSTSDPSAPPGSSPTSSSTLNNFGSDWGFKCTAPPLPRLGGEAPPVTIFCELNYEPLSGTLTVSGRVLGGEISAGVFIPDRRAIWDLDISISGVERSFGRIVPGPVEGTTQRTVTYSANLLSIGKQPPAVVSGTYKLLIDETAETIGLPSFDPSSEPDPGVPSDPDEPNVSWVINVGAEAGVTNCLVTDTAAGPAGFCPATGSLPLTFPGGKILGQSVADNEVLRYQEVHRFFGDREQYYPVGEDGIVDGNFIPTPNDGDAFQLNSIADVLNSLFGGSVFARNEAAKPLIFEPDEDWRITGDDPIVVRLDSEGCFFNDLGLQQGFGEGSIQVSLGLLSFPFCGERLVAVEQASILSNYRIFDGVRIDENVTGETPFDLKEAFLWFLESEQEGTETYFSDPTLNPEFDQSEFSNLYDHMLTYDLGALDGKEICVDLGTGSEQGECFIGEEGTQFATKVKLVRPKLIAWEESFGGFDSFGFFDHDFNDAIYLVSGIDALGASGGPFIIMRFCHSSSLTRDDDPSCLKEDPPNSGNFVATTGDFESQSLPAPEACDEGAPLNGTATVETGVKRITITSANLGCRSETTSETFEFGFDGIDVIDGQTLDISTNSTVVSRKLTGLGVNSGRGDGRLFKGLGLAFGSGLINTLDDGTSEALTIKVDPDLLAAEPSTLFISVSAEFFVGLKTQLVKVEGFRDGAPVEGFPEGVEVDALGFFEVTRRSRPVTGRPHGLTSNRIPITFSEPVDRIVFSAGPESFYGLIDPIFGTVVEAQAP